MLYKETEKKKIERIYEAFADYIRESPYLEWLWSDKLWYRSVRSLHGLPHEMTEKIIIRTAAPLSVNKPTEDIT